MTRITRILGVLLVFVLLATACNDHGASANNQFINSPPAGGTDYFETNHYAIGTWGLPATQARVALTWHDQQSNPGGTNIDTLVVTTACIITVWEMSDDTTQSNQKCTQFSSIWNEGQTRTVTGPFPPAGAVSVNAYESLVSLQSKPGAPSNQFFAYTCEYHDANGSNPNPVNPIGANTDEPFCRSHDLEGNVT